MWLCLLCLEAESVWLCNSWVQKSCWIKNKKIIYHWTKTNTRSHAAFTLFQLLGASLTTTAKHIVCSSSLWRQHWASTAQNKWPLDQRCLRRLDDKLNPSSQRVKLALKWSCHWWRWTFDRVQTDHRHHQRCTGGKLKSAYVVSFPLQTKSTLIKHWDQLPTFSPPPSDFITLTSSLSLSL